MVLDTLKLVGPLLMGDHEAVWNIVDYYKRAGNNSLHIYHSLLTPAMQHIGKLWEMDVISVADEHLASATCESILSRCMAADSAIHSNGMKAMLLCLEGEQHSLGLKMVSSLMRNYGYEVRFYGQSLPIEHAQLAAMRWKPDLIALSVSIVYHLPKLLQYTETLRHLAHQPTIMVGGRLAKLYDLKAYVTPGTVVVSDLMMLQEWLTTYAETTELQILGAQE